MSRDNRDHNRYRNYVYTRDKRIPKKRKEGGEDFNQDRERKMIVTQDG